MGFLMGVSSAYGAAVYWQNKSSIFVNVYYTM